MNPAAHPSRVRHLPVHEPCFSSVEYPVSAHQDNTPEFRENRRRRSRFVLPAPRHLAAVAVGGILAAVLVHYLGFIILSWFDLGIHVHRAEANAEVRQPLPDKIVLKADDRPAPDVVEVPEPPDIEQLKDEPAELPDLEDMLPEQVVIAPGETSFSADPVTPSPPESLSPKMPQVDMKAVARGLPEPSPPDALKTSPTPATIKTVEPEMVNPDEWYNNRLKGAGGQDDSHLPDGSKSLSQLMAQSSLGKDSGYSRLGADLLFEYNKAVMKNSARLSMLQLAGLMMKNPNTIFIVEGHTDSFGSEEYNAVLSLMRANAVRQWLKDNGINLSRPNGECRLYIRACGASRPVVSTRGDQNAQAANRRVEIHMRKPGEEIPAGSKPVTYAVDMNTPIARQVRDGAGARAGLPSPAGKSSASPAASPPSVPSAGRPAPAVPERRRGPVPQKEDIPEAEPVPETIPSAEPVEENIPSAEPVEDDIPLAEPVVFVENPAEVEGGRA